MAVVHGEVIKAADGTPFRMVFCPTCGVSSAILESTAQASFYLRDKMSAPRSAMPVLVCPHGHRWNFVSKEEIAGGKGASDVALPALLNPSVIDTLLSMDAADKK